MKKKKAPARFEPSAFPGGRACVLGLGRSGLAAASLLASKGFKVFVSEAASGPGVEANAKRLPAGVAAELGGHSSKALDCDFAVKSPGLSPALPVLRSLKKAGLPVFSEVETALAFCASDNVWAVTGTNGKTTTTTLLGEILREAGLRPQVAGNIGAPVSAAVEKLGPDEPLVLEVSSYQLEDSRWFRPRVAAVLNLTPDHLDHHGSMKAYGLAKARIFRFQGPGDVCVFNRSDAQVRALARTCPSRKLFFGPGPSVQARLRGCRIELKLGAKRGSLRPPALLGRHNLENAAAAALMAAGGGVEMEAIQAAFDKFKGVEHRLEASAVVHGVTCINDSKATNVDSTRVALEALKDRGKRLILILGGLDKGAPYKPLAPLIRRTTRAILTIGSAAPLIERDLAGAAPIQACGTLKAAVEEGLKAGRRGDILLLSPACASFDQFKDYEHRGRTFKDLVEAKA